jgi:hypothetical protein
MFYRAIRTLQRIAEHPYLNIVVGLILLYSGIFETVHELKGLEDFKIGAHHGVILFAILHIFKALPHVFEGLKYIEKAGKEKRIKAQQFPTAL